MSSDNLHQGGSQHLTRGEILVAATAEVLRRHPSASPELSSEPIRLVVANDRVEIQEVFDPGIERMRRLEVRELIIDPNSIEGQKYITQMGALHDAYREPSVECLRQFVQGDAHALDGAFKYGGMPEDFDPPEEHLRIYRQHQAGYLSPKEQLIGNINNTLGRPGRFHVLGLIDLQKSDTENLQGYLTFRLPPLPEDGLQAMLDYIGYMEELFSLNDNPTDDMHFTAKWNKVKMREKQIQTMGEIDTIIVGRGNRNSGGPIVLIDKLLSFIEEKYGDRVKRMFATVFAGYLDIFHQIEDEQVLPTGRNRRSGDFFEGKLKGTRFATRTTPNEVIVRNLGVETKEYHALQPSWDFFLMNLEYLRDTVLMESEILQKLGRRSI